MWPSLGLSCFQNPQSPCSKVSLLSTLSAVPGDIRRRRFPPRGCLGTEEAPQGMAQPQGCQIPGVFRGLGYLCMARGWMDDPWESHPFQDNSMILWSYCWGLQECYELAKHFSQCLRWKISLSSETHNCHSHCEERKQKTQRDLWAPGMGIWPSLYFYFENHISLNMLQK